MKKLFSLVLCITLLLAAAFYIATESLSEEMEIYQKTLRLHIPANSDSKSDQEVKLKVRDAVIQYLEEPLSSCSDKQQSLQVIKDRSEQLEQLACNVLLENGKNYGATVNIVHEYYPTRHYEGISLPAGYYDSLKIELGEAQGQNWWCVLFPQVCVGSAKPAEALAEVGFTANQIRLLTEHEDYEYVVKFKLLEVAKRVFG